MPHHAHCRHAKSAFASAAREIIPWSESDVEHVPVEGLRIKLVPDAGELEQCRHLGEQLARHLTGKVEQLARDDAGRRALVASIAREKGIAPADTVVVGPASPADIAVPELGVRVLLDKENFRSLVGKQVITAAQVPAILAAFGPR